MKSASESNRKDARKMHFSFERCTHMRMLFSCFYLVDLDLRGAKAAYFCFSENFDNFLEAKTYGYLQKIVIV